MADVTAGDRVAAGPGELTRPGRAASAWPGFSAVRVWWKRRPLLGDVAITALFVFALAGAAGRKAVERSSSWWVLVLELALVLPLGLRRRYPFSVFCWMYTVAAFQALFGRAVLADAALLVALYTVAAHCDRRHALIAFGMVEAGVIAAVLRWSGPSAWLPSWIFLTSLATAAWVLGVNLRTRRAYLTSLEDRAVRAERERDQQAKLATAAERARIAREMHDIVAHNLTVMVTLSEAAAATTATAPARSAELMRNVSGIGRRALTDTRSLLGVLRQGPGREPADALAPVPGIAQLDELAEQVRAAGLDTTLEISGQVPDLPEGLQLTVYRLVQEALTNALKHAGPGARATVRLRFQPGELRIDVDDDGAGKKSAAGAGSGSGLLGMKERARAYGGDVTAGPGERHGWQVSVRLRLGA